MNPQPDPAPWPLNSQPRGGHGAGRHSRHRACWSQRRVPKP